MLQTHSAIRAHFDTKLASLASSPPRMPAQPLLPSNLDYEVPRILALCNERFERHIAECGLIQDHFDAEQRAARISAYDAAVAKAASVLRTTDVNMILAAVRRSGLTYRNGDVRVSH